MRNEYVPAPNGERDGDLGGRTSDVVGGVDVDGILQPCECGLVAPA